MRRRTILWIIALAVIFGCGWYKSHENRTDRDRWAAWERLRAESNKEMNRIGLWLDQLSSQSDARQKAIGRFSEGKPLVFERDGEKDVTSWTHPEHGIFVEMDFWGEKLVAHGLAGGTAHLSAIHPQPEQNATSSRAERVRKFVAGWGGWFWWACLALAIVPWSYGRASAEMTLVVALACGVAWTVSPHNSISIRDAFLYIPFFFSYGISLVVLAIRTTPIAARGERSQPLRFGMRTLLAITSAVAVLSAMGRFGLWAMCVVVIGGSVFYALLRLLSGARNALSKLHAIGAVSSIRRVGSARQKR